MKTKQVLVLRKDLNMRKGKMVAQGAHASMAFLLNRAEYRDRGWGSDRPDSLIIPIYNEFEKDWLQNKFTKICCYVESELELLELHTKIEAAGIPCSLIKDAGLTEFKEPTFTAIGVGPDDAEKIDIYCGKLPLL